MSLFLYFRRAFFENGRGALKRGSILIPIRRFPKLDTEMEYVAIDYAPQVVALIQEAGGPVRDMTREEKGAIERVLDALTEGYDDHW